MSGNNLAGTLFVIMLSVLVLGGCSGTTHLGKVGDRDFYGVHSAEWDGPNITALVSVSDGKTRIEGLASGQGMLTGSVQALLGAGGNVASAALIANGMRSPGRSSTNVNNSTNVDSSADAESNSQGGGGGGGGSGGNDDCGNDDDGGGNSSGGDGGHGGGNDSDDNGHGNDDDHDDDSNPGQGGGGHGGDGGD